MNQPFDKQPTDYDDVLGTLIQEVGKITGLEVIPNERIAKVKKLPFVSFYPLTYDIPVYSDPTINYGQFESTISLDIFCKTLSDAMKYAGALHVYLSDPYVRQELRQGKIVIDDAGPIQGRAIENLPFDTVHHHGFDVTIRYSRHFQSPIDQISNINFNN
ncbi:LIC_12616 family protein [Lentilactobacillus sp. SPB1-3]|uniref:Uncharacterized protein n=1 Tax=Lentilactobacillus terminaliae TaxID=3003483 RepID=A0ACD5DCK4_9LACO|nr:hypothetical protein [Lentilactobacillus sp. SPB1-3]MCZ0978090.1 hypothetical protein [Lentilactobacillus sp. SPB1-3]